MTEFETIQSQNPRAMVVTVEDEDWLLRPPTYAEWHAFLRETDEKDAARNSKALEDLTRACLLYPTRDRFNAALQVHGALGSQLGNICIDAAKATVEVRVKKSLPSSVSPANT